MEAVTENSEFLASLPLFARLDEWVIDELAAISQEYTFDKDAIIAYQRDAADSLYIVKSGRLYAKTVDPRGIAREGPTTRAYAPGQYFQDVWLFVPGVHPATVRAVEEGRLLVIPEQAFLTFINDNLGVLGDLAPRSDGATHSGLSDEAWVEARKLLRPVRARSTGARLLPDELVEYYARRSGWYLLLRLLPPVLLILIALLAFFALPGDPAAFNVLRWLLLVIAFAAGAFMLVFRLLDWRNDYFVITNRHLTHHEFSLRTFRVNLVKVPVFQIQTVEILKPSLVANMLNFGTARVTTAAVTGVVLFDNVSDPILVKDTLERLMGQAQDVNAAQEQLKMRRSLEQHFELEPSMHRLEGDEAAPAPQPQQAEARRGGPFSALARRYGWRVVEGDVITYRRSFYVLFARLAVPLLGLTVWFLAMAVLASAGSLDNPIVLLIMGVAWVALSFWFIWRLENWRNDIFQLTDRFVIDIDRKPFGFGESRKQAPLTNIQNVRSVRPGLIATLLNFGEVSVETAGTSPDIVFENVPNPAVIQADIFKRLDKMRLAQAASEAQRRQHEYALLVDIYHQTVEEQRIPNRIPPQVEEL